MMYVEECKKIWNIDIHVVDESNHVKTEWGTSSLADAILLMMQFSIEQHIPFNNLMILSPACYPLYSLEYIYNKKTKTNKSWIHGKSMTMSYPETFDSNFKFFKEDFNIIDGKNYSLYYSGWFALTRRHMEYFFMDITLKNPNIS